MKSIKLTDNRGYALTERRIVEISHELNGAYYGQDLGPVYDQDGNHTEQMQALEAAGHIGRTDDTRPVLTGIHLSGGAITSTDGYRLFSKGGGHSIEALIPAKVAEIIKATKLIDNNWRYGESEYQATFTNGNITIITQKIDGNYPEWQGLLPKSTEYHIKVEAKALAEAVKLLKGTEPIDLHITTEGAATVQAGDRKLELQATIETGVRLTNPNNVHIIMPLKTDGANEIALNTRYIADAIGKNKHILIDFNESKFGPVDVHGVAR